MTQTRSAVNHGNHNPAVQRLCEVIAAGADQVDARADAAGVGRKSVDRRVNRNFTARRLQVHYCCKRVRGCFAPAEFDVGQAGAVEVTFEGNLVCLACNVKFKRRAVLRKKIE